MTESRIRTRMKVVAALAAFMFAALTTRLWFLQVLASEQFVEQADENHIRLLRIQPLRGQIMDRNGKVLVGNRSSTIVTIDRYALEGQEDVVLQRLSTLLGVPERDLRDRLNSVRYLPYQPIPVAEDVPEEAVFYIKEHPDLFPGVDYEVGSLRDYQNRTLAAHLLGYVGEISEAQLDAQAFEGYEAGDVVGKAGVEAEYERFLQGKPGTRALQVNAQGKVLDKDFNQGSLPPTPGNDVVLSIDAGVQKLAEESLRLGIELARGFNDQDTGLPLKADGGAVIVMDPSNGRVVAMASSPTYDPAVFEGGISRKEAAALDLPYPGRPEPEPVHDNPLLDRAVLAAYPPGSTFKPFVAAAAMHQGFADEGSYFSCPPSFQYGGNIFRNWSPRDYGFLSIPEALVVSCDTVFYQLGVDYWDRYYHSGRTNELMQRDLSAMGFGRPTGIDLPSELPGLMPTERYKHDLFTSNPKVYGPYYGWLPGDYINLSIGQGFLLVTPVQLAVAYSALANGGTVWKPRIAWKVQTPEGDVVRTIKPKRAGRLPVSRDRVLWLRDSLRGVVESGTASYAFLGFPYDRIPVAAKTGTAEIKPRQPYSWFAAMAPADDPQYVVVAMVEQGGHGSTTAAPIVRRILEGLFGLEKRELAAGGIAD